MLKEKGAYRTRKKKKRKRNASKSCMHEATTHTAFAENIPARKNPEMPLQSTLSCPCD
jgi:hypothetical protein